MVKRSKRLRLGTRDREILNFVGEQRMSWLDGLHVRFFKGQTIEAAKSTVRRLRGRPPQYRYLRPEVMDSRRVYYRLTGDAARLLGFPTEVTRPLGRTSLIRRYALQWFICLDGQEKRWKCNPRDYPQLFSVDGHRLPPANFYIEKQRGETRFGIAVVDFGTDARRLARRTVDKLERFSIHGWFDDVVAAGKFEVTVLTATTGKARSVQTLLHRGLTKRLYAWLEELGDGEDSPIELRLPVVPGLLPLLPGNHH